MTKFKLFIALILTFALVLSGMPASADEPMIIDFRNPALTPMAGMIGYGLAETQTGANWLARYPPLTGTNAGCQDIGVGNCKDVLTDVRANKNDYRLSADIDLSVCREEFEQFCIESLSLANADGGPVVSAQLVREPAAGGFAGVSEIGFPRATAPSLWRAPGHPNAGGEESYVVRAHTQMILAQKSKRFMASHLSVEVFPVKMTNYSDTKDSLVKMGMTALPERIGGGFGTASPPADCALSEPGVCAKIQNFSPNTRVEVLVRTPAYLGWIDGRVDKVDVQVEKLSNGSKRLRASGLPMQVPSFAIQVPEGSVEANALGLVKGMALTRVNAEVQDSRLWGNPLQALPLLSAVAKDRATGSRDVWRITSNAPSSKAFQCSAGAPIIGVVTSNAMAYSPTEPTFDGDSFIYQVAGMHLTATGQVQEGFYNLLIDSRTARCLAKLPSGNLRATIQIVDSEGTQSVTTSTFVEKDGWLNVRVAGFHFSSPTLRVKFSAVPKTTITCVSTKNKKLTKKVAAVSPKCPAGYKKQ